MKMDESPVRLQAMRLVRHLDQAPTEQVHTLDVPQVPHDLSITMDSIWIQYGFIWIHMDSSRFIA